MKRNINFKNVLCMAAITLVTGMLGGCEDNSIATPVGKLPNETALDNNFGMLKCDMTTSDLEITMTNTKTPDFAFFYQTVKPVAQDTRITMKIDLDLVDKYNEEHGIIPKTVTKKVAEILEISTHKEEGKEKTILFNLSGHGMIDLYAYEQYFAGNLQNYTIPDSEITCSLKDLEKII